MAICRCASMDGFSWIYDERCCADGLLCLFDGSSIRCKYYLNHYIMELGTASHYVIVLFDLVFFRFRLTSGETGRTLLYLMLLASLVITAGRHRLSESEVDEKTYTDFGTVFHDCHYNTGMATCTYGAFR